VGQRRPNLIQQSPFYGEDLADFQHQKERARQEKMIAHKLELVSIWGRNGNGAKGLKIQHIPPAGAHRRDISTISAAHGIIVHVEHKDKDPS